MPSDNGAGVLLTAALFVVMGMLRRGTRRLTAIDHPGLDERDVLARDRAFRLAYPLLMLVLLVTVVVLVVALSDIQRTVIQADTEVGRAGYFIDLLGLAGLAVWVTLWGVYLPTGVLAWREPDALDPDPDELAPAVPEVVRDALLAVALAGGLAAGLLLHSEPASLLPLIVVLMVLGGLERREAGQPPVQAATLWRLAASAALAVVLLAALFLSVGGGS